MPVRPEMTLLLNDRGGLIEQNERILANGIQYLVRPLVKEVSFPLHPGSFPKC